ISWLFDIDLLCVLYYFFFFFSSRRRHTRSKRDWSSDVCSSDLRGFFVFLGHDLTMNESVNADDRVAHDYLERIEIFKELADEYRSEERRVGKECRCRRGEWKYRKREER